MYAKRDIYLHEELFTGYGRPNSYTHSSFPLTTSPPKHSKHYANDISSQPTSLRRWYASFSLKTYHYFTPLPHCPPHLTQQTTPTPWTARP